MQRQAIVRGILSLLCVAGFVTPVARGAEPRAKVDFSREVRPMLSKACFRCHGPDAEHRRADLRLDEPSEAVKELASGETAIVPGKPDSSELFRRITADDAGQRMPPRNAGDPLTPEQIETIRLWIEQGARYAGHWSFARPVVPSLPPVNDASWPKQPIDYFVLARLEAVGLRPTAPADRYALIRRLSFDLRGLPPTPDEVAEFVGDVRAEAFERLVDRFLSDAAYGERWARVWLDLARYADSKGYAFDATRTIWRYRNWVIEAFNRNLPFDQFTIAQLAGDLVENPTLDQRIATAFHRNTMTNAEGIEDEESRVAAVRDRAETTFQVWMGLTLGCAKCHDHKFDPISQADYYRSYAFFNQTADKDQPDEAPTTPAPTLDMLPRLEELDAEVASARRELEVADTVLAAEQCAWEEAVRSPIDWIVLQPKELGSESGAKLSFLDDGLIYVGREMPPDNDVYTVVDRVPLGAITALRLETVPDDSFPNGGAGLAGDGGFVLMRITARVADGEAPPGDDAADGTTSPKAELPFVQAVADFSQAGFPVANAIKQEDLKKSGWGIAPQFSKPHVAFFIAGSQAMKWTSTRLSVALEFRFQQPRHILGRFRLAATSSPHAAQRLAAPAEILEIVSIPTQERTDEQRTKVAEYFRTVAPALAPLRARVADIEKLRPPVPTVPVMVELAGGQRRNTRIMLKGNHLEPGEPVDAGVPASLNPLPAGAPGNRLGLAQWLVAKDNPLTARVTVNRIWSQLFGSGLVETEEDFGTQGEVPSHPELLDWLAIEFMDGRIHDSGFGIQGTGSSAVAVSPSSSIDSRSETTAGASWRRGGEVGWDLKRLLKTIVLSATYRQSSQITPDRLKKDPRNRLLSRGPRFRLDAEMVRDQALALSGLLSRKIGGPSVYPPQPAGVWQIAFSFERNWATSTGPDRYRRGIYTFWRRSAPYPSMLAFDAPSRELCTIRRSRTNTPLQAFVTLNDPVHVEAAQALARRIVREGGATVRDRAEFALQLCLLRPPTERQVSHLVALYEDELTMCTQNREAAIKLATDPLGPLPEDMAAPELAAWTMVGNVLLNLDGVLMKN